MNPQLRTALREQANGLISALEDFLDETVEPISLDKALRLVQHLSNEIIVLTQALAREMQVPHV